MSQSSVIAGVVEQLALQWFGLLPPLVPIPPPSDTRTPWTIHTLLALIANAGITPAALAASIGVDSIFLTRVLAGRQPLPIDVARLLAAALKLDVGTVVASAELVTQLTGPMERVALPPDPLLGDVISAQQLGRTIGVVTPPRSAVSAWVCGAQLGGSSVDGIVIVDRAMGPIAHVPFVHSTNPAVLAFGPGGRVYSTGGAAGWNAAVDVAPAPKLALEVADTHAFATIDMAYEETTNTIWLCSSAGLIRIGGLSPLDSTAFNYSILGHAVTPTSVVCFGGHVYVLTSNAAHQGGVLKIEPSTGALVTTWTSAAMNGVMTGLAWDGVNTLLAAGGASATLFSVDVTAPATPPQTLTLAGATLHTVQFIAFVNGAFWVSDSGANPHYVVVTLAPLRAILHADLTVAGATGNAGRVAKDVDGFVWATLPAAGEIRIFNPTATSGDPTVQTFAVGGTPLGLLLL